MPSQCRIDRLARKIPFSFISSIDILTADITRNPTESRRSYHYYSRSRQHSHHPHCFPQYMVMSSENIKKTCNLISEHLHRLLMLVANSKWFFSLRWHTFTCRLIYFTTTTKRRRRWWWISGRWIYMLGVIVLSNPLIILSTYGRDECRCFGICSTIIIRGRQPYLNA